MQLEELGWSETFAASFVPYVDKGYQVGRVAIARRGQYQLSTEWGDRTAVLTGKFRHQIEKSEEFPAAGTQQDTQVIAANIDTLFLVSGLDYDFNLRRIERYLVMAW